MFEREAREYHPSHSQISSVKCENVYCITHSRHKNLTDTQRSNTGTSSSSSVFTSLEQNRGDSEDCTDRSEIKDTSVLGQCLTRGSRFDSCSTKSRVFHVVFAMSDTM